MQNAINWFEIPAVDFDRAVQFYSKLLGCEIRVETFQGAPNGFLPFGVGKVGGAIIKAEHAAPSTAGTLVYLNAEDCFNEAIGRVEKLGGTLVLPATSIGDPGTIAIIIDSEGNRVGLHSREKLAA